MIKTTGVPRTLRACPTGAAILLILASAATFCASAAALDPAGSPPEGEPSPASPGCFGGRFYLLFGQRDCTQTQRNATTPFGVDHASGVAVDRRTSADNRPAKVYVADRGNNRILGYDGIGYCRKSPSNGCNDPADCPLASDACVMDGTRMPALVFGQPDFTSGACNGDDNVGFGGAARPDTLCLTGQPYFTNNRAEDWTALNFDVDGEGNLWVPDIYNNRVVEYRRPFCTSGCEPGAGDTVADFELGQGDGARDDFASNGPNGGTWPQYFEDRVPPASVTGLDLATDGWANYVSAHGVSVDDFGSVWVADTSNHRVVRFPRGERAIDTSLRFPTEPWSRPLLARYDSRTQRLYVLNLVADQWAARIEVFSPTSFDSKGNPSFSGATRRALVPDQPFVPHVPSLDYMCTSQPFADWECGAVDWQGQYVMAATGFALNPYLGSSDPRFARYASGIVWINETMAAHRTTLLDPQGTILAVLGPRSVNETRAAAYFQCASDSPFQPFTPMGSPAFDPYDHILTADEENHRVASHELSAYAGSGCPPDPIGGLFPGTDANVSSNDERGSSALQAALAGYQPAIDMQVGETPGAGMAVYNGPDDDPREEQLIVLGNGGRVKVWNDYTHTPPGAPPTFVLEGVATGIFGQANLVTAGGSSNLLLWTNSEPPLAAYPLPLTESSSPVGLHLEWNDQTPIGPIRGGLAYDEGKARLYLADPYHNRILRVSNVSDFATPGQALTVDAVIGQSDTTNSSPNHGAATPQSDGLSMWVNNELKFDGQGNLFVVENDYEGHGNVRIVMLARADLDGVTTRCADSTTVLCALIPAAKAFVGALDEAGPGAFETVGEPGSPISVAFDRAGEMVVSNDGYYGDWSERPWRQIWIYRDPLRRDPDGRYTTGQKPDFSVAVPMGAPGEVTFDSHGLLLIQDHTWDRVLGIDLARDGSWLANASRRVRRHLAASSSGRAAVSARHRAPEPPRTIGSSVH
ncbi:MAG: hypothetical protein PHQ91_15660 [Thermoanaerobaculaceae bacterium]|nr:hypothetical protein [Thermoanaerobaculaceae bacterium]